MNNYKKKIEDVLLIEKKCLNHAKNFSKKVQGQKGNSEED